MTENKSAMERLRVAHLLAEEVDINQQKNISVRVFLDMRNAARAVLAEHDAAQSVPPSEAAKAWREQIGEQIKDALGYGCGGMWASIRPLIDEAVRNWCDAAPSPQPEHLSEKGLAMIDDMVDRTALQREIDFLKRVIDKLLEKP